MQLREVVIWHEREHVVLHMVVHVPVEVAVDGAHVNRAAVEPVIEDVFRQARVLGVTVNLREP